MEKAKPERRYDLDWLRVLLIFSVFLFHSSRPFVPFPFHINDSITSEGLLYYNQFLLAWMLPTIFIVSGASIWYSLQYQSAGRFLWSKVLRLFVPLAVGAFILSPHQVYIERLTRGQFSGAFFEWLPRYFDGIYGMGGNFAFFGLHLWYLMMLFLFSILLLPLFLFLRSKPGRVVLRGLGWLLKIPGVIYLLGLVLTVPMAYLDPQTLLGSREGFADWNMVYYLIILFIGFLIFADQRIQRAIIKQRYVSLVAGLVLYLLFRVFGITIRTPNLNLGWYHYVLSSWCLILAILGFGMKHLTKSNRFLRYATPAVLPFYILHQPVIVLLAFWIIRLQIPVTIKYLITIVFSFAGIMILYEGIRRIGVLRFFFGMKLRRGKS